MGKRVTNLTKNTHLFTETEIDDEIVVMRLDTGDIYSMTGTAAAIWRLIDGKRDRAALTSALFDKFDGSKADISVEFDQFIAELKNLGFVADC